MTRGRCISLKAMNTDPTVLLGPQGQELLARLAAEPDGAGTPLALAVRLRREYPADLVAAATAQHELRLAARAKFSRAMQMLFTRAGYEQSSSEPIARYRAARFGGARRVADLCCGIGGDLLALADGRDALAVDRDDVHARLALHNAAVYGQAENARAVVADVRDIRLDDLDAVFIDPARRSGPGTALPAGRPGQARRPGQDRTPPPRRGPGRRRGQNGRRRIGRAAPVQDRPVGAAPRLVLRARRPGPRGLRQGRSRAAGRPDTGRLGGGVHRRRPRPQGGRPLVPGPGDGPRRRRRRPAPRAGAVRPGRARARRLPR